MKILALSVTGVVSLLGMMSVAWAKDPRPPCYLDHVSQVKDGFELHFNPMGDIFVSVQKVDQDRSPDNKAYQQVDGLMYRYYRSEKSREKAPSEIVLHSSEEASVMGGPHAGCTIQPGQQDGKPGVIMKVVVGLPGIAPSTTSEFLPADAQYHD